MSNNFAVVATPAFKITLKKLFNFLKVKYGNEVACSARDNIKEHAAKLAANPYAAPVSERLESLGFTEYRQLIVDQHNLVFYRVDEDAKKIILILVLDSRQSIEQLLFETMIRLG